MCLDSDNIAYTAVDAVLQVFRRRLTAQQGLEFADILPCVLRAIFVDQWDVTKAPAPFVERSALLAEVKRIRPNHNLTPDNAIEATAWAIRRCTNKRDFERALRSLPEEATAFWHVDVDDPAELEQRVVYSGLGNQLTGLVADIRQLCSGMLALYSVRFTHRVSYVRRRTLGDIRPKD